MPKTAWLYVWSGIVILAILLAVCTHKKATGGDTTFETKAVQPAMTLVISYSLYGGNNNRYIDGAIANAKLMPRVYPGWVMRVYHDNSIPTAVWKTLGDNGVELINMEGYRLPAMTWRFLAASDEQVLRFCSRDIDSRLSMREKAAVDEWILSGKAFHVMRDHPSHSGYEMSGGMWCATNRGVPDMADRLYATHMSNEYLQDMTFLTTEIWPIARQDVLQHDSFSCDKFGGGNPFPTTRIGWEHVGSVYINGNMRKVDVDILKRTTPPPMCTLHRNHIFRQDPLPSDLIIHAEWEFLSSLSTTSCQLLDSSSCSTPQIVNAEPCICNWLQTAYRLPCPAILLLSGGENFGVMDPAAVMHYPKHNTGYRGCSTWETDRTRFGFLLEQANVIRVFYRQTPPIEHYKIELVPLGPSRQFVKAWNEIDPDTVPSRSQLYYVNHSPWRHRQTIFDTVNRNFNGMLQNEYCAEAYGCTKKPMSDTDFVRQLQRAWFVESPPGVGEDCYRHYEAMLAGAVPVIQRSLTSPLFKTLPHVSITNWADVTPLLLERVKILQWHKLANQSLEHLTKRYWINRVKYWQQQPPKDALVGYATGYSFPDIYRQVHAFSTVTSSNQYIVLFVTLSDTEKQSLTDMFDRCILIHPDEILTQHDSYNGVALKDIENIAYTRFFVIAKWARLNQHVYTKLIVSDIRDIAIFSDPFVQINSLQPEVQVFTEVVTYQYDRWYNQPWVRDCYGQAFLNEIISTKVTCVGVIAGTTAEINQYLAAWIEEYKKKGTCHAAGTDTAIHVWIVQKVLQNARIVDSETALIRHAPKWGGDAEEQLRKDTTIHYDNANRMLNANGQAYAIIHQLDRFADLWNPYIHAHRQPVKANTPFPICIGVLAFQGVKTLENTLTSYRNYGLFEMVSETHVLFQQVNSPGRMAWATDVVSRYRVLHPIYEPTNIGQRSAFIQLAHACSQPYLVVLEEDFQVSPMANVREQLELGITLLQENDAVPVRHRKDAGSPNYAYDSYMANTCCGGKNPGATHMIEHTTWSDTPELEFKELKVCVTSPKTWCTTSKNAQYTNNPTLYKTAFATALFQRVPENEPFEPWLTQFWSGQSYNVARSTGIFKHNRIDRVLGNKLN